LNGYIEIICEDIVDAYSFTACCNKVAYRAFYALYGKHSGTVLDFDCSKCRLLCDKSKMAGVVYICSDWRRNHWMYVFACIVSRRNKFSDK
jgi:hypothetical protein